MRNSLYIIVFCSLIACELVIEVERPDFKPSIVVGSIINPNEQVSVKLNEDRYILDGTYYNSTFKNIEGATVRLYENNQMIGVLEPSGNDDYTDGANYILDFKPEKGQEYRLEVEKEGYNNVSATEQLPSSPAIFLLNSVEITDSDFGSTKMKISLDIEDSEGDDYYKLSIYHGYNREFSHWDEVTQEIVIDSVARTLEEQYLYFENEILFEDHLDGQMLLFNDALFKNSHYELNFNHEVYSYQESDPEYEVIIEIQKVSESYYNYYNSVLLQSWVSGDPFSEPVQVFSNIEEGKGIFGSFIAGSTIEIPLD